ASVTAGRITIKNEQLQVRLGFLHDPGGPARAGVLPHPGGGAALRTHRAAAAAVSVPGQSVGPVTGATDRWPAVRPYLPPGPAHPRRGAATRRPRPGLAGSALGPAAGPPDRIRRK